MHTTAWQSLQLPPFQGVFHDRRTTTLQIQNFTSESYEFIKRRERKKAEKRKTIDIKLRSKERNVEEGHPPGPCYPGSLDLALIGSKALHQARRVAHDSCAMQSDPGAYNLSALPPTTPESVLETQATPTVDSRVPESLPGVSSAASADYDRAPCAEPETLPFSDIRNSPVDGVHGISGWDDDLDITSVQSEQPVFDPERHAQAPAPQAGFVCEDTGCSPDDLEIRPSLSPSTSFSISQSATAVTSTQCRTDDDQPPMVEFDVKEQNVTTVSPTVAALSSQSNQGSRGDVFDSWSNTEDELLLHLRDVAQLDWHSIAPYFPNTLLSLVKHQYRQLSQFEMSRSSSRTYPTPGNTVIPASTPSIENQASAKIHRASSHRSAKIIDRKLSLQNCTRMPKSTNTVEVVAPQAAIRAGKRVSRRIKKHGWDYVPVPLAEDRRRHDHRATINEDNIIPGSGGRGASRGRRSER